MSLVFCLFNLCFLYLINEVASKSGRDILADCVNNKVGNYYAPFMSCIDKCANGDAQKGITSCFFSNKKEMNPGATCVRNDARCYVKKSKSKSNRKSRDAFWNDDVAAESQEHYRFERATKSSQPDWRTQVLHEVMFDQDLKNKMLEFRKCRVACVINYHSKNRQKLLGKHRSGRSILEGAGDLNYHRERRQADDKYFNAYLGHCYKKANCKSSKKVSAKCMPLFFPKKDPKKFCLCLQQYQGNSINCARYNEPNTTAQVEIQPRGKNVMNMNVGKSDFSAGGNFGRNNVFGIAG